MFPLVPCPDPLLYCPIRRWLWGAIHLIAMSVSTIASFFSPLALGWLRTSLEGKCLCLARGKTLAAVEWGLQVQWWDPAQKEVSAPKVLHVHHVQMDHHSSLPCNDLFLGPPCPQPHVPILCPWCSFTQHFPWCPSELCGMILGSLSLLCSCFTQHCCPGWLPAELAQLLPAPGKMLQPYFSLPQVAVEAKRGHA